jgi:protoheme IX farnesyltransferase
MKKALLYGELAKPRIVALVLVTTALGFFLGGRSIHPMVRLLCTLLGTGCATGGAAALNNYLECDLDARMVRTHRRALPAGLIKPHRAMNFGVSLVLFGALWLAWTINLLTGFLVLLAAFLYVLVYTPLKRITWLNTSFGAIPGAIPPMAGWAAATGRVDAGAWVLFAILFVWQHPHFYAIAWMCRDDYRAAGLKMLPVVEPSGTRMFRQTIACSVLLVGVSVLPTIIGVAGRPYFYGALLSSLVLLAIALRFARERELADARRLLKATVIYLPLLLLLIILDADW